MARCCTKLGQRDRALDLANLLVILHWTFPERFSMQNKVTYQLRLRKHLSLSNNVNIISLQSKEASNTCHLTSLLLLKVNINTHIVLIFAGSKSLCGNSKTLFIWNIKVSIYQHFGCVGAKMSSLQQLCSLLPFNPWHWHNLGQTCLQLLQSNRTAGGMDLLSLVWFSFLKQAVITNM